MSSPINDGVIAAIALSLFVAIAIIGVIVLTIFYCYKKKNMPLSRMNIFDNGDESSTAQHYYSLGNDY